MYRYFTPEQSFMNMEGSVTSDEEFMKLAMEKAREGIEKGQLPFGAAVVKGKELISCAHNTIYADFDVLAHAEINAIQEACKAAGTLNLAGHTLYATCEPCPMCFGACVNANISRLVYSSKQDDWAIPGFTMLPIPSQELKLAGKADVEIIGEVLREEGTELFRIWKNKHFRTR
jgi:tRNA(Arg) A34 adenosine deaminase TadA